MATGGEKKVGFCYGLYFFSFSYLLTWVLPIFYRLVDRYLLKIDKRDYIIQITLSIALEHLKVFVISIFHIPFKVINKDFHNLCRPDARRQMAF